MKYLSIFIRVALLALGQSLDCHSASEVSLVDMGKPMYNHNKAQQSKNGVHIPWDILYQIHVNALRKQRHEAMSINLLNSIEHDSKGKLVHNRCMQMPTIIFFGYLTMPFMLSNNGCKFLWQLETVRKIEVQSTSINLFNKRKLNKHYLGTYEYQNTYKNICITKRIPLISN